MATCLMPLNVTKREISSAHKFLALYYVVRKFWLKLRGHCQQIEIRGNRLSILYIIY